MFTEQKHFSVVVDVLPDRESYELGSQVILNCSIAPSPQQYYTNSNLPLTYQWYSTVRGGLFSSTQTVTTTIPVYHPTSADYYCQIYQNGYLVGTGKKSLKVKGTTYTYLGLIHDCVITLRQLM